VWLALAVIFTLLTTGVRAAPPANLAEMNAYSYKLCSADTACSLRWFIDEAPSSPLAEATFAYLFANWVSTVGDTYVVSLDVCSQFPDSATTQCQEFNSVRLVALRAAWHCRAPNQQFVFGRGCVCPAGKNCGQRQAGGFFLGLGGLTVALVVIGVVITFSLIVKARQINELQVRTWTIREASRLPLMSAKQ
jgi:hypothetical protein